jgi:hypothetical protein
MTAGRVVPERRGGEIIDFREILASCRERAQHVRCPGSAAGHHMLCESSITRTSPGDLVRDLFRVGASSGSLLHGMDDGGKGVAGLDVYRNRPSTRLRRRIRRPVGSRSTKRSSSTPGRALEMLRDLRLHRGTDLSAAIETIDSPSTMVITDDEGASQVRLQTADVVWETMPIGSGALVMRRSPTTIASPAPDA